MEVAGEKEDTIYTAASGKQQMMAEAGFAG
jgi:hypothetical protein